MAEGLAHIESASGLKPVLVSIEDGWQIGYLLEKLENDWVAVFFAAGAHADVRQHHVFPD
jgi:hypothetical protein